MKTEKPNNPFAFANSWNNGMTLRDYFASKAMSEVPLKISQRFVSDSDYDEWAKNCYKRADAMLKQRELIDDFCEYDSKNRNLDMPTYLVCKECDKKL